MIPFFLFILGLCIGSFLNVVVDRLSRGETLFGRSHCEFCKHKLSFLDLVPLLSFVLLQGKCRYCHRRLEIWYPIVEVTTGVLFVITYFVYSMQYTVYGIREISIIFLLLFIVSSMIVIFFADLKYGIILDKVLVLATGASFLYLILNTVYQIPNHLFVGVCTFLFFFALFAITKGRGIGFGDVKYAFFMGFLLGFPSVVSGLYVAFLTGAAISLILVIGKKKKLRGGTIPFGPFLVVGTFIGWWYGSQILKVFFGL